MVSVGSLKEDVQATFEINILGRNLSDDYMVKLINGLFLILRRNILFFLFGSMLVAESLNMNGKNF